MRLRELALGAVLALSAVHCASEDKPKSDPNVVENNPGALVITSPARAAMIEDNGSPVEVTGTGATSALTINGVPAEVKPDGSFHATIKPEAGLDLIVAVDGESRLEQPLLFGHFLAADKAVARAVTLDIGPSAIAAQAPAASLTSVANLALADRDLVGVLKGQSFDGSVLGATWKFDVTGGQNGAAKVALGPQASALGVDASIANVEVDGNLSMTVLGKSYSRPVRILVANATVTGGVAIAVDPAKGALTASMPTADTQLDGFQFDTDNAGFPCCVDTILSSFMKPKVEEAIRNGIQQQVPQLVKLTLDGLGVPKELDLSTIGVSQKLPVATRFDDAGFDAGGGTISVAALFGGPLPAGAPGAKAPGWLALGKAAQPTTNRVPTLGATISLDAVNQLMFATWGTGNIAFKTPAPFEATLSPALPPVVSVSPSGALRIGIGEIVVQRSGTDAPMAAVTVLQDITPSGDADALVLTPTGDPTISITWLDGGTGSPANDLIATAAKEQLQRFLKPFRVPLPKFALDGLGGAFVGQSLAIDTPAIAVDRSAERVSVSGALKLVQ